MIRLPIQGSNPAFEGARVVFRVFLLAFTAAPLNAVVRRHDHIDSCFIEKTNISILHDCVVSNKLKCSLDIT